MVEFHSSAVRYLISTTGQRERSLLIEAASDDTLLRLGTRQLALTNGQECRPPPPDMWQRLWNLLPILLNGALLTVEVSFFAILLSAVVGLLGGLGLVYGSSPLRFFVRAYVDLVRGIPALVLLFVVYYILPVLGLQLSPFSAGVIALTLLGGAHVTENMRGGISSIPRTQVDAAKAIGLVFWSRLRWVILPQAVRRILPPFINTAVDLVKGSALASLVGLREILLATQQIAGSTFIVLPTYALATILYLGINYCISLLGDTLEKRYAYLKY